LRLSPLGLILFSLAWTSSTLRFPYLEASVEQAAVGFCVHSGWSALVAIVLEKGQPSVLHRDRLQLVEEFSYKFRQPYHTAEKMPSAGALEFISKARTTAGNLALCAIQTLQVQLETRGYDLDHGALLLASGKSLPELNKILASHALIHTADGELFRDALAQAGEKCGLLLLRIREKELLNLAAETLGKSSAALLQHARELGRPFGSPWSRDEKFASLAAWLSLRKSA
jgi:hypothetical protein